MFSAVPSSKVNPFEDDIVREPRDISFSVTGLNDKQLGQLIDAFTNLESGEVPRRPVRPPKAQLLISPDRGYGKSHLLGRLFQSLHARATQVCLRPFQDPHKTWHSILLLTVQELKRPSASSSQPHSQLKALALGALFHLSASLISRGAFPDYKHAGNAASLLRRAAADPTRLSADNAPWLDWLKALVAQPDKARSLAAILTELGIDLHGREQAWLKAFAAYACSPPSSENSDVPLKWLRAEPLEAEELIALHMTAADNEARGDSSAQEVNDLSFNRLRGLCLFSSFYRPFLFCFDQTEFFGSDLSLIKAFGNCIDKLFVEVANQLTVITANHGNWLNDILPRMEHPQRDRIGREIRMDGIAREGAAELIRERFRQYDVSEPHIESFSRDRWLDALFEHSPGVLGVRTVLMHAAERFRSLVQPDAVLQKQTLDDLFKVEVNNVRSAEALQAYNQDALMWFAKEVGRGQEGASVTMPTGNKYFSIDWSLPGRSVSFAFEAGDSSQRWRGIANEAIRLARGNRGRATLCYIFRTPDLGKVPRETWTVIRQTIDAAASQGLRIYELTLDQVCELHAARELYSDALQGNIPYAGEETLAWLQQYFQPLLKELSFQEITPSVSPRDATTSRGTRRDEAAHCSALGSPEQKAVVDIAREMRLVDIRVVLAKLGGESFRDALLRFVEGHPNLKAHSCPQTIFLQWRITA